MVANWVECLPQNVKSVITDFVTYPTSYLYIHRPIHPFNDQPAMSVHQTLPNLVSEFNLDELETARTPKDLIIVNLLHINTSIKKKQIYKER